jgi:hypothetical protein
VRKGRKAADAKQVEAWPSCRSINSGSSAFFVLGGVGLILIAESISLPTSHFSAANNFRISDFVWSFFVLRVD